MITPLVTWGCVVGLFLLVVFVRSLSALRGHGDHRLPLFSIGSEREELFVPGDPNPTEASEVENIELPDDERA